MSPTQLQPPASEGAATRPQPHSQVRLRLPGAAARRPCPSAHPVLRPPPRESPTLPPRAGCANRARTPRSARAPASGSALRSRAREAAGPAAQEQHARGQDVPQTVTRELPPGPGDVRRGGAGAQGDPHSPPAPRLTTRWAAAARPRADADAGTTRLRSLKAMARPSAPAQGPEGTRPRRGPVPRPAPQ